MIVGGIPGAVGITLIVLCFITKRKIKQKGIAIIDVEISGSLRPDNELIFLLIAKVEINHIREIFPFTRRMSYVILNKYNPRFL